ncbi:MAG TPA: hypothetical protein VFU02_07280, partial [Polyangiaceae bacterium]|nr:hypothetical protein [Polyangiaceae bacterium]
MSYASFGAKSAIAGYTSLEAEFSTLPVLQEPTRLQVSAHLSEVAGGLEALSDIAVGVLADADTRPVPPVRDTLQDLIAAARARLAQRRAQIDHDRSRA